jgi:hypothetical protein
MADLVEFGSGLPSICFFSRWFDTTEPAMLVGSQIFFLLQDSFFSVLFSKTERIYSTLEFIYILRTKQLISEKYAALLKFAKFIRPDRKYM